MKQSVLYRVGHFKMIRTMRAVLDLSAKSFRASTLIVFYIHYSACLYNANPQIPLFSAPAGFFFFFF